MINIVRLAFVLCLPLFSINSFAAAIGPCDDAECVSYFKEYKKYARAGYSDAMATLGDLYFYGHGVEQNTKKALKQYRSAAKYGSVKGQYNAAMLYLTDEKYKDLDDGVKYLKKAARSKNVESAFLLGIIYFKEDYYEQDFAEADKWLTQAYEGRHSGINDFIAYMKTTKNFSAGNFSKLWAEIKKKPIPVEKVDSTELVVQSVTSTNVASQETATAAIVVQNSQNVNNDNIEVITITSNLHDLFRVQIDNLKNTYPEKGAVNTGSRIIGKSCAKTISCGSVDRSDHNTLVRNIMGHQAVLKFKAAWQ